VKCQAADAESLHSLGLSADSALVMNIRQCVVRLASNTGVVHSVQCLAQSLLSSCWSILLPTTEERVTALSALLPLIASAGILIVIIIVSLHCQQQAVKALRSSVVYPLGCPFLSLNI